MSLEEYQGVAEEDEAPALIEYQSETTDRWLGIMPIIVFSAGIILVILGIVFVYAFNGYPSAYYALNARAHTRAIRRHCRRSRHGK